MMEYLEDAVEDYQDSVGPIESKKQGNLDILVSLAKSEFSEIETSVKKLYDEIKLLSNSSISLQCKSVFDNRIELLTHRLTTGLLEKVSQVVGCYLESSNIEDSTVNLLTKFQTFVSTQQDIVDICTYLLTGHVEKDYPVPLDSFASESNSSGSEFCGKQILHVLHDKSKPPKFKRVDIDLPEFKRKSTARVAEVNLPVTTKLDGISTLERGKGFVAHHSSIRSSGHLSSAAMLLKIAKLRTRLKHTHRIAKDFEMCLEKNDVVETVKVGNRQQVKRKVNEVNSQKPLCEQIESYQRLEILKAGVLADKLPLNDNTCY